MACSRSACPWRRRLKRLRGRWRSRNPRKTPRPRRSRLSVTTIRAGGPTCSPQPAPRPREVAVYRPSIIAGLAGLGIVAHLSMRWAGADASIVAWPLYVVLAGGGVPLVASLVFKLVHRRFGSDLLAGISIV